jgi:cell division protein FtsW
MNAVVHMHGFKRAVVDRQAPAMQLGVDQVLIICALCLLVLGIVMVASASMGIADRQASDPLLYVRRHMMYAGLGIGLAILMQRIRLVHWEKSGAALVFCALFLLTIVLIPGFGRTVNGATRWLDLGVVGLQASEPARLLLIVYLAGYLVRRGEEVRRSFQGFLKPMVLLGLACLLILFEPDFGSAVVLLLTALGMMYLAGVRLWQFALLLISAGSVFALLAVSSPYRLQRLTAFLDPWSDPFNTGFQLTQSLIAFGSGGWTGVGLGRSVQKLFYLPEAHNDFLFAVLAEELGLFGVLLVLVLFGILIWRALSIAARAERCGHLFAAYLANGLALWIAIQSMINIGVNMGVLPTKGLTLPLVSAGGSSMLVMCAAIGLLLRINLEVTLAHEQVLRGDQKARDGRQKKSIRRGGS